MSRRAPVAAVRQPKPRDAECVVCGEAYTAYRKSALYCSQACSQKASATRRVGEKTCNVCGELFMPLKVTSESCSALCRQASISRATIQQRADARRGTGAADWYVKRDGRHEHRVVAEELIGRPIGPDEVVHHVNEDKKDNRPENLRVMTRSEHTRMHTIAYWEEKRRAA